MGIYRYREPYTLYFLQISTTLFGCIGFFSGIEYFTTTDCNQTCTQAI